MLKINAVVCNLCKDTIYSRARHDYHSCSCGATTVDGGFEYLRYGWSDKAGQPISFQLELDTTKKELYDDWNKSIDKYGIIKNA